jgi:hypothetical protein
MPDALSYTNFLRLGTSFGMKGVQSPKLSPMNCACPLALVVDISRISVYIGIVSLFLASSSLFLYYSSIALSAASLATFFVAYFVVVVVHATTFSTHAFCSNSFWEPIFFAASTLALALSSLAIFLFFSLSSLFLF